MEFSNGNNSIARLGKGGIVNNVEILENDHEFFVDNLPLGTNEKEVISLFEEYGEDILKVRLFEPTESSENNLVEKSLSAEILVADTEDSAFFVTTFDQVEFKGRMISLRHKSHNYQVTEVINSKQQHFRIMW